MSFTPCEKLAPLAATPLRIKKPYFPFLIIPSLKRSILWKQCYLKGNLDKIVN